jgi:hypothetical protein
MRSHAIKTGIAALAIVSSLPSSQAHELPSNRLTVVLRDNTHVTLTYFIDYTAALHQALEPKRAITEFAMIYSAMPTAEFQKALAHAQNKFSSATKINLPNGEALPITNWRWPEAAKVQTQLQQRVMQSVVAANDHRHEIALEIQAEAVSNRKINNLSVSLPYSFGTVMVVSYKPNQTLVKARTGLVPIKF